MCNEHKLTSQLTGEIPHSAMKIKEQNKKWLAVVK